MASDKQMEKAREVLADIHKTGLYMDALEVLIVALANAEREGMKRAVEIAQAEVQRLDRLKTEDEIISSAVLSKAKEGE